ncbi:hypothetical protein LMG31506_05064 [Cupriavidus yeoncheonensis]|uniref:Uncharacterized protein n=1 Tax=Cupriavidus yeoncheonensis TaxID=1462994 RepID=A0A916MXF7_9BURK|nr:hypothetical protein [Cupriavidus yeoncheonensis]CAG2154396.1 hypothetical protein LMG31506_05064 [Cupriavidus yeoncheonensis]
MAFKYLKPLFPLLYKVKVEAPIEHPENFDQLMKEIGGEIEEEIKRMRLSLQRSKLKAESKKAEVQRTVAHAVAILLSMGEKEDEVVRSLSQLAERRVACDAQWLIVEYLQNKNLKKNASNATGREKAAADEMMEDYAGHNGRPT